jgi:hypothetical protein
MLKATVLFASIFFHLFLIVVAIEEVPTHDTPATSRKGRKRERKPAKPITLDLGTLPLKELIAARPSGPNVYKSGDAKRFKEAFAKHPDVQKINLYDTNVFKTAHALTALKGPVCDKGWQCSLTTSIKNYINEAPFEKEEDRKELLDVMKGIRTAKSNNVRQQRYLQNTSKDKLKQDRQVRESRMPGGSSYAARRQRQAEHSMINKPLSVHLGDEAGTLTATQVEGRARHLSQYYTSEQVLTSELRKYLLGKKTPPAEYAAAMARRVGRERPKQAATKRRKTEATTPSSSTGRTQAKDPGSSTISGANASPLRPPMQHVSPPPSSPSMPADFWSHVDPEDPNEWIWLLNQLRS